MTSACLALALFLMGAPAAATPPAERTPLNELLDFATAPPGVRRTLFRVQVLSQRGRNDEAEAALTEHVARHPDEGHPLVLFHLGHLLLQRGEATAALPHLRAATVADPRLWPAWRDLGEAAYAGGRYAEAAAAFDQSWRREPDPPPELLHYTAAAWLQADEPGRALPLTAEMVSGRHGPPPLEWCRTHVAACLAAGEPARADPAMAELVHCFPDDPEAWLLASRQAAAADDRERAAAALETVGYLRPLTRAERVQLGDLYRAVGVPAAAARHYAAALEMAGAGAELVERLASSLLAAHQRPEALAVLDQALATAPTARLCELKGDVLYVGGEYAAALESFARAAALDPADGRAALMQGYCAWELGQSDVAAAHLRRAAEHPDQAQAAQRALQRLEGVAP